MVDIVVFRDVFLSFAGSAGARYMVLRGVSFEASEGEVVLVTGPSGSGKTSLLKLVLGLLKPDAGIVRVFGEDPASPSGARLVRRRIGYQAQEPLLIPQLSVEENIRLYLSLRGASVVEGLERAKRLAEELGIAPLLRKRPPRLSGGELRRAELVLALSDSPPLLLLDEPTAMLDHDSALAVIRLLERELQGKTAIIATHDPRLRPLASRELPLMDSKPSSTLNPHP